MEVAVVTKNSGLRKAMHKVASSDVVAAIPLAGGNKDIPWCILIMVLVS